MKSTHSVYLDNAANPWPKPPEVLKAVLDFYSSVEAIPGIFSYSSWAQAGNMEHTAAFDACTRAVKKFAAGRQVRR